MDRHRSFPRDFTGRNSVIDNQPQRGLAIEENDIGWACSPDKLRLSSSTLRSNDALDHVHGALSVTSFNNFLSERNSVI